MALVLVDGGVVHTLNLLRTAWAGGLFAGLYGNDRTPARGDTAAGYDPATFDDYAGLNLITAWQPPVHNGERWIVEAAGLSWFRGSGLAVGYVYGYYVVDGSGVLIWAERAPGTATYMAVSGQRYRVTPRFSLGSFYPPPE